MFYFPSPTAQHGLFPASKSSISRVQQLSVFYFPIPTDERCSIPPSPTFQWVLFSGFNRSAYSTGISPSLTAHCVLFSKSNRWNVTYFPTPTAQHVLFPGPFSWVQPLNVFYFAGSTAQCVLFSESNSSMCSIPIYSKSHDDIVHSKYILLDSVWTMYTLNVLSNYRCGNHHYS